VNSEGAATDPRDDLALLRAHSAGDRSAFSHLVRRHRDRLWAVALRTLGDPEEAADGLQDGLLSAYRAAPGFRGDSAVTTWLHRIVVNACLDRVRRRNARRTVPLPEVDQTPAVVADHETSLVVREALNRLPIEQRAAIVLVDLQGYPVAEVASILGIAEGTVKSRCARGRARLAVLLGHLREGDVAPAGAQPTGPTQVAQRANGGRAGEGVDASGGAAADGVTTASTGNPADDASVSPEHGHGPAAPHAGKETSR
jgi:RNA polymerase sigma-70 factor (ECF subfamily)